MEKYQYHFIPQKGWCNDPNGTIFIDGKYHLFYQFYPDDVVWGPMHWGHATSIDLINWEYNDVAIVPDEEGYIFSGSCIYDEDISIGNIRGVLAAFYTEHNPDTGEQQQCMALSHDFKSFEKYSGNPVISNLKNKDGFMRDFRDPKVFKNPYKKGYSMVLAAGNVIQFYYSDDLINWEYTGDFNPDKNGFTGICECPDCFRIKKDGKDFWVLTVSLIIPDEKLSEYISEGQYPYNHVMKYFIGRFDGDKFEASKDNLVMDYGLDNYAMVSFYNVPLEAPLLIGWGECWEYVNNTPLNHNGSRGKMTLPRTAKLVNTKYGLRLSFDVAVNIPHQSFSLAEGQHVKLPAENGNFIEISILNNRIYVERNPSKVTEKHNKFKADRLLEGECQIKVYRDGNFFEIFAEDGLCPFSVMVY